MNVSMCLCQSRTGGALETKSRPARGSVRVDGRSTEYVLHSCPRCGATAYSEPSGIAEFVVLPVDRAPGIA